MNTSLNDEDQPWYFRHSLSERLKIELKSAGSSQSMAIIGGGIASAMLCYHLCRRGYPVTLYCQDAAIAQNASGNGQGAIYPLLNASHDGASQFYLQAFEYSLALYQELEQEGLDVPFSQCGVSQLGFDAHAIKKNEQLIASKFPHSVFQALSPKQTNEVTGLDLDMPCIHYQRGGWVNAKQMTKVLMHEAMSTGKLNIQLEQCVNSLQWANEQWQLGINKDSRVAHPVVIIASGHTIADFEQTQHIPLTPVRGQVSHIPSYGVLPKLKTVLCYKGYLTPNQLSLVSHNNVALAASHHLGASHQHNERSLDYSEAEQQQNKNNLSHCLSSAILLVNSIDVSNQQARVAIRSASRDHLPFVGQVPKYEETLATYQSSDQGRRSSKALKDLPKALAPAYENLYMLAGLGSRGLCSSGLCSDILVRQMLGEKQIVDSEILNLLNPNRIWMRKLLKGRPLR